MGYNYWLTKRQKNKLTCNKNLTQHNFQMLKSCCTVFLHILNLERRLLDVYMKFFAEHCGLMRAAGGPDDVHYHRILRKHSS